MRQIEHLIAIAGRRNEEVALLAMDLNGFKDINDQLGHAAGDDVLREFGRRLGSSLRKSDRTFRIGGDEFAVLLEPRFGAFDGAIEVSKQIAKRVAAPMEIKGHTCSIGVSIGIAVFPDHGRDPNSLLRKADGRVGHDDTREVAPGLLSPVASWRAVRVNSRRWSRLPEDEETAHGG